MAALHAQPMPAERAYDGKRRAIPPENAQPERPARTTIRAFVRRLVPRFSSKIVLGLDLDEVRAHHAPHAIFRFGDADDLDAALAISNEGPPEIALARARLDGGDRLVLGRVDGHLMFYAFVMRGRMEVGSRIVPIANDAAYAYKLFTVPSARGKRIAEGFYAFLATELAREGAKRLVACVAPGNAPSMRLHERCGFERVGWLGAVAFGETQLAMLGPRARAFVRRR